MAREVEGFAGPLARRAVQGRPVQPDLQIGHARPRLCAAPQAAGQAAARRPCGRPRISGDHRARRARASRSPAAYGLCLDEAVIGTALLRDGDGRGPDLLGRRPSPRSRDAERPAYFDAMNATIAALHAIDPEAAGLGDYGKPGNYFARQIGALVEAISRRRRGRPGRRRWTGWSNGCPHNIPPDEPQPRDHPRRLPLRQHDLPSRPSRGCWRCSTGSCRRSATRSPTSPII